MLSPQKHRLTSWLLSLAYLAISTASGLFHDHGRQSCNGQNGHGTLVCQHSASRCSDHDHEPTASENSLQNNALYDNAPHGDDCTVCRFIGKLSLPVVLNSLVARGALCGEVTARRTAQPAISCMRTIQARAPPLLG